MDGWNTIFLGRPIFGGDLLVSGRGTIITHQGWRLGTMIVIMSFMLLALFCEVVLFRNVFLVKICLIVSKSLVGITNDVSAIWMFHIDWQAWQANEKILLSTSPATTKPCWNPDSKGFTMQRSKVEGSVEVASAALVGSPTPGMSSLVAFPAHIAAEWWQVNGDQMYTEWCERYAGFWLYSLFVGQSNQRF